MAPPSSMMAEYAKSNRSSCKACSKTIDSKALRLGLVTKDPRGFDAVKWHHLACFPLSSHSLSSPEHAIEGFSSLKSSDQEALKKLLVAGHDKFKEKDDKGTDDIENELPETEASDSMKRKFDKATDDIENELLETEASDSKNRKYAKSSRSSCKVCSKTIESKALRLGLVTKDPRGFDATKWHHLTCFPLPSHSHSSPEHAIKGFSSLKCSDQEALKKLLVAGHDKFQEKDDKGTDDIENELPETEASDSMKRKVDKATDDIENELLETEASDSKNRKYAKSSRSSCKVCSKRIESKALRLGLVTKDPRGFDATKWHHLACFPLPSHSHSSPEHAIKGFSSLKCSDQDALKKVLVAGHDKFQEKLCAYDVEPIVGVNFSVSDVKSKYKDAALLPKWKAFQTVIFLERDDGLHDSSKIAAFDFDGCLAKTDVKRVGPDLWSLMYPSIPDKLQSLYNDGFKLVIFTNESNIERWKYKRQVAVDSKIGRLNNFIDKVKVPIQVFIACGLGKSGKADREKDDPFRKPQPGMWQLMEQHFNSSIAIDMDQSFYVGDAAGRESDHSDADIEFAKAIGLKFYVPEDYFGA